MRIQLPDEPKIDNSKEVGMLLGVEGAIIQNDGIIQYLEETKSRRRFWKECNLLQVLQAGPLRSTVPREGTRMRRSYGQRNLCIPCVLGQ